MTYAYNFAKPWCIILTIHNATSGIFQKNMRQEQNLLHSNTKLFPRSYRPAVTYLRALCMEQDSKNIPCDLFSFLDNDVNHIDNDMKWNTLYCKKSGHSNSLVSFHNFYPLILLTFLHKGRQVTFNCLLVVPVCLLANFYSYKWIFITISQTHFNRTNAFFSSLQKDRNVNIFGCIRVILTISSQAT